MKDPVYDCDVSLADGGTVHLTPIQPDDGERLIAFHSRLSPESLHLRYFAAHPMLLPNEVERFTHVDGVDRVALLEHLAAQARAHGITTFLAETLWQNLPMQKVLRRSGFSEETSFDQGVVDVKLDIRP